MSRRTDNRHRVATLCREATGLAHHTCLKWAAAGLITRRQPVPDADGAAQRAFEAQMVYALANALRDDQRPDSLLGFTRAEPYADGLVLGLHPALADRVLGTLLPHMDEALGWVRGVPGLRLTPHGGEWVCTSVTGAAMVRLVHPDADWRPRLPPHADGVTQLWRRNRHRAHPAEAASLEAWSHRGAVRTGRGRRTGCSAGSFGARDCWASPAQRTAGRTRTPAGVRTSSSSGAARWRRPSWRSDCAGVGSCTGRSTSARTRGTGPDSPGRSRWAMRSSPYGASPARSAGAWSAGGGGLMLAAACVTAAVLGVAKVVRDWLILRQVRAAMEACSPADRVRIGMRLAGALGGRPAEEGPPPDQNPDQNP